MLNSCESFMWCVVLGILMILSSPIHAEEQANLDSITDENFVIASLLLFEPEESPLSYMGHVCFRMQCPTHGLDYCFSYASESEDNEALHLLIGDLRMGMLRIDTDTYLEEDRRKQRGVTEYVLNMPIKAKQNLWRILDEKVDEGLNLPFDLDQRGCANSAFHFIDQSLDTAKIYTAWDEKFINSTRREACKRAMDYNTWHTALAGFIFCGDVNKVTTQRDNVVIPKELIEVLQASSVNGRPLISEKGKVLIAGKGGVSRTWFTPNMAAVSLLLLTLICGLFHKPYMQYALLGIQTVLGTLIVYLVAFSSLSFTEWNWLIVPLNPLPALLWKWRRRWQLPYAGILLVWIVAMIAVPHPPTESYMIILAGSICLAYSIQDISNILFNTLKSKK